MSASALKQAVTGKKVEEKFPVMLEQYKAEIAKALPRHLNADRMARIALTAFRRNPKLGECDPRSVFAAAIQSAQLGLEPDTLGRSYLIPYKVSKKINNKWESHYECQFIPGWRGLVDLVNRSGTATVYTGVIFKDQTYTFKDGSVRDLIIHNETDLDSPADITHAYAIGWVKGAVMPIIDLWRVARIVKHRDRYNKVGNLHYSYENWEMYARKVPLLQVLKYMPMSPELSTAVSLSYAAEVGGQGLTTKDVIEGTWAPVEQDAGAQYEQEMQDKEESAAPASMTFDAVKLMLVEAKTADSLDEAIDCASSVISQEERAQLVEVYKKLREEMTK